jgi:hypothetical protein
MPFSRGGGLALVLMVAASTGVRAQHAPSLTAADRVVLAEAFRVSDGVREHVWPGWHEVATPLLLVTDSAEFLLRHSKPDADFAALGRDPVLREAIWTRPRHFPPMLLATFPAVGGIPTTVVGRPARTGKTAPAWVLTILHEQFHQLQTTRPGYFAAVDSLHLSRGDSTGMWMLNYPFPYDSAPVQQALQRVATALDRALAAAPSERGAALAGYRSARTDLSAALSPDDERYLEFQLWQEGVARYVEYECARAAGGGSARAFRQLAGHERYADVARAMEPAWRAQLQDLRLGERRRVAFYALGAATAELLTEVNPRWKERYFAEPFRLDGLFTIR